MTKYYQPKIANFEFSRNVTSDISREIGGRIVDVVRWLAPEKIRSSKVPYSSKCEVFSFGMLLWELSFEKIPYKDMGIENMIKLVKAGGREKITFGPVNFKAWHQDPDQRPSIMELFESLKKLAIDGDPPVVYDDKTLDLDGSSSQDDDSLTLEFEDINFEEILPFDEGIKLHKKGDDESRKLAWECFVSNAKLGCPKSKYWQGQYLYYGYGGVEIDYEQAARLFKEAADEGNLEAQVFYALAKEIRPKDRKELIKYLTMGANNGNRDALFNLGNMTYKKDFEQGLKYLKLAAIKGHPKAIEKVKAIDKRDR